VLPRAAPWIDVPRHDRDTLVLVPGAAWGPKRAPLRLLQACGEAWDGPVAVLGSAGEADEVQVLAAALPAAQALAEDGFEGALDLLARARVCVAGDTGLLHLAAACGVVPLGLFGPTHPADGFFPYAGEVVQRDLACRPCALHRVRSCRMGDLACHDHDPATVVEAMWRCAGRC
jgi:ADP-heptose:LPS heptosyltransferase